MKKNLYKVVLLGAAWGIFEATAGYLIHLSGLRIGSYLWFPIAYFFVHKAYQYTESFPSAMLTALIASALKLINLFFPGRIDMVINPAVSIMLEAFAIVLVYNYVLNKQIDKVNPLAIALTGFIWRGFYVWYIFSMPREYFSISSFTATDSFLEFMFVKNGINIAIISIGFFGAKLLHRQLDTAAAWLRQKVNRKFILNPIFAAGLALVAIVVQVAIG